MSEPRPTRAEMAELGRAIQRALLPLPDRPVLRGAQGVTRRAHPPELRARALALLQAGVPQWRVAVELGVGQTSVWRWGAAAGVAREKPGRRKLS